MKKAKKLPTIRPGQKKAYRKATNQEVAERIQEVVTMLGNAYARTDIIRAFRNLNLKAKQSPDEKARFKYDLDWRTIDNYINRARKVMLEAEGKTRQIVRGEAIAFYESVLKSDADKRTKIAARQRLDDVYGVDEHKRLELSGLAGEPIQIETKSKEPFDFDKFRNLQSAMLGVPAANGAGESVHSTNTNGEAGDLLKRNGS